MHRPLETEEEEAKKLAERAADLNKEKEGEADLKKERTGSFACVFECFAGNGAAHGRLEDEEGRKPSRISPRPWISRWRVNPRAASGGGVWRRHAATAPQFLRASSTVPDFLGNFLVIFRCLNMYLIFC